MPKHRAGVLSALAVVMVSLVAAATTLAGTLAHRDKTNHVTHARANHKRGSETTSASGSAGIGLPVASIEKALQIKGTISNGVLSEGFDRTDINDVTIHGVPIKPPFQINGEWDFQSLGKGNAMMNGDMPVKPSEVDPVISALVKNHLVFQALHQHMYDFNPIVFFIHVRAKGGAVTIAHELHNVLLATSTPLPQAPPTNPTTPLNAKRLETMLHGFAYDIGDDGVVTVDVAPAERVVVDGVTLNPRLNIMTNISFEPLNSNGSSTAVIADYAQTPTQVMPFEQVMRVGQGWDIGCLYNQETDESPQLFFSHVFKTGNPYELAQEVAKGEAATGIH